MTSARSMPQAGPSSIKRRSLHDEVIDSLRQMINDGRLAPNERIQEKALCLALGVSRTPLREALKVLASEGLVELLPSRGAVVTALTVTDIREMFPVMARLESLAGELACRHATDPQIAEIGALQAELAQHFRRGDRAAYFRVNQKIHAEILGAAGNRTLIQLHRLLSARIQRARNLANLSTARWAKAVAEHEDIYTALAERDASRLGGLLQQHLMNKADALVEALITSSDPETGRELESKRTAGTSAR